MIDVLVVEDDAELREAICNTLALNKISFHDVENGRAAESYLSSNSASLVLSDVQMSPGNGYELLSSIRQKQIDVPVILMTAYGSIPQAVDAIQAGAVDYLVKPFEVGNLVSTVRKQMNQPTLEDPDLIACDASSLETLKLAARVSQTDVSVLLNGESGVGKEVYSQFIHRNSARSSQPFVAINCAAIPENMLEAVLFGYEKGAFTGAYKSSPGKFELAQAGTLLLDEISEMDLGLQAKLLRVLQEKEVERLGGRSLITLDVRILATTNRNLKEQVATGNFREDLYYRLNVFPISLPPLNARPNDIPLLADHFIAQYRNDSKITRELSGEAKIKMLEYPWPGNVRELDNVIQRALILSSSQQIQADDILFEETADQQLAQTDDFGCRLNSNLRNREQEMIINALRVSGGSRKLAANALGISARTLRYKLSRMRDEGISIPGQSSTVFEQTG
jgi:two-component system response regulator FlrC